MTAAMNPPRPSIQARPYGQLGDGRPVEEYVLDGGTGLVLRAITLGGIVTGIELPDRHGQVDNLVLGLDTLADYAQRDHYFGIIVGRYANRIAGAHLEIDGVGHALTANERTNCLHGGRHHFGKCLWSASVETQGNVPSLVLRYTSPHGEEGFPGTLETIVRYTVAGDSWQVDYEATTDRPTVVNLSHHSFFNLRGQGGALGHRLTLPASRYHEVDASLIPQTTSPVEGTPFDFRRPTEIGARVRAPHPQLARARGYDHDWLLDAPLVDGVRAAARLEDPESGRVMQMWTSEPGIQFYSGNFLDGSQPGRGGILYRQGDGVCLEPQHAPDSPHHPDWPSTVLRPGQVYRSRTIHRFSLAGQAPSAARGGSLPG
jgi:aldose 1-epimerase